MRNLLLRNLDDTVVDNLRKRAKLNQRSLSAEIRSILGEAVASNDTTWHKDLQLIQKKFAAIRVEDSTEYIRQDRDR